MASRNFNKGIYTLQQEVVVLEGNAVIGAVGAVGTVKGSGIASITRTGAGVYEIVLEDTYNRYLGGSIGFINTGAGSGIASVEVSNDPNAAVQAKTGIQITCYDYAGAAADPAAGSVMGFVTWLRNSSLKGKGE